MSTDTSLYLGIHIIIDNESLKRGKDKWERSCSNEACQEHTLIAREHHQYCYKCGEKISERKTTQILPINISQWTSKMLNDVDAFSIVNVDDETVLIPNSATVKNINKTYFCCDYVENKTIDLMQIDAKLIREQFKANNSKIIEKLEAEGWNYVVKYGLVLWHS